MTKQQHKPRGAYKLAVFFTIHKGDKPYYFRSTPRQDTNNNQFVRRMRKRIDEGQWKGKVNWATFYHDGVPFLRYNSESLQWESTTAK